MDKVFVSGRVVVLNAAFIELYFVGYRHTLVEKPLCPCAKLRNVRIVYKLCVVGR